MLMNDVIAREFELDHPIQVVWNAITQGEEISKWLMECEFVAEVGYNYTMKYGDDRFTGEVLEVIPTSRLVYSWVAGGTDVETLVEWNLDFDNGKTRVTLRHSGISEYPKESLATTMFELFSEGWNGCIQRLTEMLSNVKEDK